MEINKVKKIVEYIKSKTNREVYFGGYIGSHVLGLNDEKSDIDLIFYVENTSEELFCGVLYTEILDFEDVHVTLHGLTHLRNIEKTHYNLIECLTSLVYFNECSKSVLLKQFFNEYLQDEYVINTLKENCFWIGKRELSAMNREKNGSKKDFQIGEVNLKSLSKAYLYKELISRDIVMQCFVKSKVPVDVEETYRAIRKGHYEDCLISDLQKWYENIIPKYRRKIEEHYLHDLSRIVLYGRK